MWKRVTESVPTHKPHKIILLLNDAGYPLGILTSRLDAHTWYIDDSYYDGDEPPGWFTELDEPPIKEMDMLREVAAKAAHDIWVHWMTYQFSVGYCLPDGSFVIPADKVTRWTRQMNTEYGDLTEKEKMSDRSVAVRFGLIR